MHSILSRVLAWSVLTVSITWCPSSLPLWFLPYKAVFEFGCIGLFSSLAIITCWKTSALRFVCFIFFFSFVLEFWLCVYILFSIPVFAFVSSLPMCTLIVSVASALRKFLLLDRPSQYLVEFIVGNNIRLHWPGRLYHTRFILFHQDIFLHCLSVYHKVMDLFLLIVR